MYFMQQNAHTTHKKKSNLKTRPPGKQQEFLGLKEKVLNPQAAVTVGSKVRCWLCPATLFRTPRFLAGLPLSLDYL